MKQILIVEDDNLLNKTLTYNLELDGYTITSVLNARTAAESLKTNIFDLVLLDINLPDGNGYDLCRLIKPEHPDTVVIFLGAIISWVCRPLTSYLISWTICYGKTIRMARKNMRILNLSSVILWSIGTRKIRPKIHLLLGTIRIHLETYALFPDV